MAKPAHVSKWRVLAKLAEAWAACRSGVELSNRRKSNLLYFDTVSQNEDDAEANTDEWCC